MSQAKRDQLHRLLNTRAQIKDELSYHAMFSRSANGGTMDRMRLPKMKPGSSHGAHGFTKDRDVASIIDSALNTPANQMVMPLTATSGAPKGMIKLPIFRLPAASAMPVLISNQREQQGRALTKPLVPFISFNDGRTMVKALLHCVQHLTPFERSYISNHLGLQARDLDDCEAFLRKKLVSDSATATVAASRFSTNFLADIMTTAEQSIFMTAKAFAVASAPTVATVSTRDPLKELSAEIDLVKLGFPQSLKDFLVSEQILEVRQTAKDISSLQASGTRSQVNPYALPPKKSGGGSKSIHLESKTMRLRPIPPSSSVGLPRTMSMPTAPTSADVLLSTDPNELTKALVSSLTAVQKHAFKLKKTLEAAQSVVNVRDSKGRQLMNMIGAERMLKALQALPRTDRRRGWVAWRLFLHQHARERRVRAALRMLAVRNVMMGLHEGVRRALGHFVTTWRAFTVTENQRLRRQKILDSTVLIQSAMRRFLALRRVGILRQRKKYEKLYDSTLRIQALLRGKRVRWKYLALIRETHQRKAATVIQRVYRGYVGRKLAAWVKFKKNRNGAATAIQNLTRSRIARRRVALLRRQRAERHAATKMQALLRGFLARKNIATIIIDRARFQYAATIQALVRGALTRMNRGRKIKEIQEYKAERQHAATKIQSAYRGYRTRILYRLMMFQWKQERDRLHRAATQISRIIRGFLCRCYLRDLKRERFAGWVAQARLWQEVWSDDAQAWYYENTQTGQAIWEPTRDGYIKSDGKLVLTSGEIIDDPTATSEGLLLLQSMLKEDKPKPKSSKALCTECNDRVATKKCQECGDNFCTKCYKQLHALGARRHHSSIPLGPRDCEECELLLAERYCVSCDECFCDGCWRSLHSHGKRIFHPYSEVSPDGRIDSRVYTMDGEQMAGNYDVSVYTQARADAAHASSYAASAQAQVDAYSHVVDRTPAIEYGQGYGGEYDYSGAMVPADSQSEDLSSAYDWSSASGVIPAGDEVWTEYQDDQGYPYYYNNVTGESQYESPYAY